MTGTFHLKFNIFAAFSDLICHFSTRQGGASKGDFRSLNLGLRTGDNILDVKKNRTLFLQSLKISSENVAYTDQIHSPNVAIISQPGIYPETDALITSEENIFLAIQTADCFPVFLFDPTNRIIAAVHCGWRSVLSGIIENTIGEMQSQFDVKDHNLLVSIGPGLQKSCFEIREDLYKRVDNSYLGVHPDPQKRFFDLRKMIIFKLHNLGITGKAIFASNLCTKCNENMFYSFRRDGNRSGRMMGIIGMSNRTESKI